MANTIFDDKVIISEAADHAAILRELRYWREFYKDTMMNTVHSIPCAGDNITETIYHCKKQIRKFDNAISVFANKFLDVLELNGGDDEINKEA